MYIYIYVYIYINIYTYKTECSEPLRDESRLHPENWIDRKGADLLGPTKSRLSNLAVLGINLCQTGANLGPTWGAEVGPKTGPMWATWPCTNLSACCIESAQLAGLGPAWARVALSWPKLAPMGHVGLKLGAKRSRWTPS